MSYRPAEILREVRETRARAGRGATGIVFYNGSSILARAGGALGARVRDSLFTQPAGVPPMTWLGGSAPGQPTLGSLTGTTVSVTPAAGEPVRWWLVSWRVNGAWTPTERVWGAGRALARPETGGAADGVVVWPLSRAGVLGPPMLVTR